MELSEQILEQLKSEFHRRIYNEYYPRIDQCLKLLNDDQVWYSSNEQSNSIGNLVLHLCGNIRQYAYCGIGGHVDTRERYLEFSSNKVIPSDELIAQLKSVLDLVKGVINDIKIEDLLVIKDVQGFKETVLSIMVHVIEHTSYHTGQIAFYTKLLTNTDLKFYGDLDLDKKS